MIIMSWSSATDNSVLVCDRFFTRDTESILLSFNHFEYTIYSFVGVYDQRKNQIIEYKHTCRRDLL
jgi:hypothetical protein